MAVIELDAEAEGERGGLLLLDWVEDDAVVPLLLRFQPGVTTESLVDFLNGGDTVWRLCEGISKSLPLDPSSVGQLSAWVHRQGLVDRNGAIVKAR